MKNIWNYLILIILIGSCNPSNKKQNLIDYINDDASVILKINNLGSLKSNLKNNTFLDEISSTTSYANLSEKLALLNYLNTENDIFISLFKDEKDSIQYSIVTKLTKNLFNIDSLPNHSVETLKYKNKTITKSQIDNKTLYSIIKDSIFIGATNQDLLNEILESKRVDSNLETLLNSASSSNQLSILINKKHDKSLKSLFINDTITASFTNYIMLDANIEQNALIFNGITKSTDSTKSLINIFKGTLPQVNKMATITPASSDGFLSFTFNDYQIFSKNMSTFQQQDSVSISMLFDNVTEVGVIFEGTERAIILNSLDEYITREALLNDQDIVETYRDVTIYNFSQPDLFQKSFSPLITFRKASLYCNIDNFFVFGNSLDMMQNIISSYKNQTTFSSRPHYQNLQNQFSDESSLLSVVNPSSLNSLLETNLNETLNLNLDGYQSTGLQFIYDSNFAHVNAVIQKGKTKVVDNSVSESSTVKLDADLLNAPQFVINHLTRQKEIVVQDLNNDLYLISNSGKILWKKQLQGTVLGRIEQIDMYKNGRLQLAFATANRVYVLDRDGKDVSPFPLKFDDAITQPLSVFDYDGTRNYRLLVTQGQNVFMLDAKGKTVKGFTYKAAKEPIISQPQHLRVGNKDYLFIKTKNKLNILDRTGKTRVVPKNNYTYSSEPVYLYNNKFTTTSNDGKLVTIDTKGGTTSKNMGLNDLHHITTTSKTLVALSENKLQIKQNHFELEYGNYSQPSIFYLYDKIYVSVTDLQTHKVYLFDSNAKLLNNFPVYGNSKIELDNIDSDRNLEFITKGENNTIIMYQIN